MGHTSGFERGFMSTTTKAKIYITVLALIDIVIPLPITAVMLIYVVLAKPEWFKNLVTDIYNNVNQ
jgi:hypothetical protein